MTLNTECHRPHSLSLGKAYTLVHERVGDPLVRHKVARAYLLMRIAFLRPHLAGKFTRVSSKLLTATEAWLHQKLYRDVRDTLQANFQWANAEVNGNWMINRAAIQQHMIALGYPCKPGIKYLRMLDAAVRRHLDQLLASHPSKGKTLTSSF